MSGVRRGTFAQRDDNLNHVDLLPADHRLVVHEFGYPIYRALVQAGVTSPASMRELVREIWNGARGSTGDGKPRGYPGAKNLATLDWLLIQSGSRVSAACVVRHFRQNGLIVVPLDPMPASVDASMATVSTYDEVVTKRDKHKRRLRAANEAAVSALWPFLDWNARTTMEAT